jgi:soluble lytic murein transglycosylase-like protein
MTMPPTRSQSAIPTRPSLPSSYSFPVILVLGLGHPAAGGRARSAALVCFAILLLFALGGRFADAGTTPANPLNAVGIANPFAPFIAEGSHRFGIPASWIRAVIRAESQGDVKAVSPKGAMGLMQIMPETWVDLWSRYGLGADPFDPHDNILAGAAYLRELHDRYGSPGFLAAYNAGPARYEAYLEAGEPLPNETRAYLDILAPITAGDPVGGGMVIEATAQSWSKAPLFVVHAEISPTSSRPSPALQSRRSLSVARTADLTSLVPQSTGLFIHMSHRNVTP